MKKENDKFEDKNDNYNIYLYTNWCCTNLMVLVLNGNVDDDNDKCESENWMLIVQKSFAQYPKLWRRSKNEAEGNKRNNL